MPNSDSGGENGGENVKWAKNGYGDPVRQMGGKFTQEESETVRLAVREYCAAKQVSVDRLCSECEHKADLKGAWMEISKDLPHRSVQSVYRHGLRIMHPFKRGAWTDEECQQLVDLVARLGKKWATIQNRLNRSADACRDKYREIDDNYVKGRWKDAETEHLKKLIRDHLRVDPKASMEDIGKMVEAEGLSLPWAVISKKMGNRSRLSCFKKFQKMTGIVPPSDTRRLKREGPSDAGAAPSRGYDAQSSYDTKQESNDAPDEDMDLLAELASSGAFRANEVQWDTLRVEDAHERWSALIGEWQQQEGVEATDDALTNLPLSELAQLLMDRKSSAKMAAETVEAVDLPNPGTLLV